MTTWINYLTYVVLAILLIAVIWFFLGKRKKRCNHKWEQIKIPFTIDKNGYGFPRIAFVCKKCLIAIHKPIFSMEQLKRLEDERTTA
jgi:cbb3-type cytochrome oxidase subunit 3